MLMLVLSGAREIPSTVRETSYWAAPEQTGKLQGHHMANDLKLAHCSLIFPDKYFALPKKAKPNALPLLRNRAENSHKGI